MTDEQRLRFLESIEGIDLLKGELPLYYDLVDGEVHLSKAFISVMELYEIPYRLIEDEGKTIVAMPLNGNFTPENPDDPRCGGVFCFSEQTVYPIEVY
ncbi:MAG: hypothetical protein O2887_17980 [Bacteroidetes bacterium]|nr:hypothetical protein [Bacteroidota bacterium]MDA1122345.1 hypothetical protein [Bacteroidota bacterium]